MPRIFDFAKSPAAISLALITISMSVVIYLGLATSGRIDQVQSEWENYEAGEGSKGFYLSEIRNSLGYGGLIHQFKNYVLRQDPQDAAEVRKYYGTFRVALAGYRSKPTNAEEITALETLGEIANLYVNNLVVAEQLAAEGRSVAEIDVEVRIDDAPALEALSLLENEWLQAGREAYDASAEALIQTQTQFFVAALALSMILLGGIFLMSYVRRETQEKERVGKELTDSLNHSKLLLESTAEAIYGIDLEGNCTFTNRACVNMLGYRDQSELIGQNMHELIHHTRVDGSKYPQSECKIFLGFREGKGTHVEDEVLWRSDGSSFASEYWSHPIFRDGEVIGSVVTFLDITERRLAEDQLRQSQKMEAVGQLTSGIAHDFNNMLMIIMGNLDIAIGAAKQGNDTSKFVTQAAEGAQRAADLNRKLLTFSTQQIMEEKTTDINNTIHGMNQLLVRALGEHIEIDLSMSDEKFFCKLDPAQLESSILNLAINARDAMPDGGTLKIETAIERAGKSDGGTNSTGETVRISIIDNGSGMTANVQSHAFDPFFTTKGLGAGSGLGLSMVNGFIKKVGGKITIDSEIGTGSAIHLFLPRIVAEKEASVSSDSAYTPTATNRETVLVVEDQESVRNLIVNYLADLDYKVLAAEDGGTAINILQDDDPIDLILSDMVMPGGLSGEEVVTKAKAIRPSLKSLYMTGHPQRSKYSKGSTRTTIVRKPFDKRSLAKAVRNCLDG